MGDYVTLGGQVGVSDHTKIESGTILALSPGHGKCCKRCIFRFACNSSQRLVESTGYYCKASGTP